jgi:hypothetical protein
LSRIVLVAGPILTVLIAAVTASVSDDVGASNVGIVLAIMVVMAALVDRWSGLATAATAALSFNFIHTEPKHSLRIHSSGDVVIVALLAGVGLAVSDITAWRRRRDAVAIRHRTATGAPQRISDMLTEWHPVSEVWPAVTTMILDQLSLADCTLVLRPIIGLPVVSRTARPLPGGEDGFVLPSGGALMPVVEDGVVLGHLVLRPKQGITSLWVERRAVVALANHLAIALTYTGRTPAPVAERQDR